MAYTVLIGESMEETTVLTDTEYKTIRNALRLARSEDKEARAIACALSSCDAEMCKSHGGTLRAFLDLLLLDLGTHADEIQGLLFERPTHGTMFMREEEGGEHAAALKAFLKILQSDNWLAKFFLPVRIEMYAEHTPTPLRVMQDLTESVLNFECDIMDAKRTMCEWPELVGVTPPEQAKTTTAGK
jgi:hypothetical protein